MQNGSEFTGRVFDRLLTDLHRQVDDNFDADRYRDGKDALLPVLVQRSKTTFNLLVGHADELLESWRLLADDASRALYLDLLAYRMAGPEHVRLPANRPEHWLARRQGWNCVRGPSALEAAGQFGSLMHCEVPFLGRRIALECWPSSVAWSFFLRQYFFERDGVVIAPRPGDVALDGGACLGDTALAFAAAVGDPGQVHAFDPAAAHLEVIRHNLAANPWARVTLHPFGLAERDQEAPPLALPQLAPGLSLRATGDLPVPLRRIDTLLASGALPRLDFLKLDIEGAELAALAGAEATLRRFRPRLAISLYHRPEDLFTIPLWLRDLDLGYRFHLEHYTIFDEETVLYAVAN